MLRITSSSSSVFRYAVGAISSCRSITNTFNGRDQDSSTIGLISCSYRFFCSDAVNKQTNDCKPVKLPKSEDLQMPAKPKKFPFKFKDDPNDAGDIILTTRSKRRREKNFPETSERIEVIVHRDEHSSHSLALTVTVFKSVYNPLKIFFHQTEFKVFASDHGIKVTSFLVDPFMDPSVSEVVWRCGEDVPDSGLYHVEEEGDVQNGLREYLRIRGINESNCEFLHKYMLKKKNQTR